MEYRQLQHYRAFFKEGTKQKGKLLTLAIELAELYLTENGKNHLKSNEETNTEGSTSDKSRKRGHHKETSHKRDMRSQIKEEPDSLEASCQNNKNLSQNLKKRKPKVQRLSSSGKLAALNPPQHQMIEFQISQRPFDELSLDDAIKGVEGIAEALSSLRANPEVYSKDQREKLYAKINEFCCYCRARSDDEIQELVLKRVGSYLTVLIHLLIQVNEQKSVFFKMSFENLAQMLAIIKRKTFEHVIDSLSSSPA